jgi:Flp pilus assembly protein TadG
LSTAFLAVLMPIMLVLAGLSIDGGQVLAMRRDTQALADGAARAGAAQIDETILRSDLASDVVLDPIAASNAAEAYVSDYAPRAQAIVTEADQTHIVVQVTSRPIDLTLLRFAGVGPTVRVQATGRAEPRAGITAPGQ